MAAVIWDDVVEQGKTFSLVCRWRDASGYVDLTGYTIRGKVRRRLDDKKELCSFTVVIADQGTTPGQFTVSLTAVQTAALPFSVSSNGSDDGLKLYYDIEAVTGSTVYGVLKGVLTSDAEATK